MDLKLSFTDNAQSLAAFTLLLESDKGSVEKSNISDLGELTLAASELAVLTGSSSFTWVDATLKSKSSSTVQVFKYALYLIESPSISA